MSIAEQLWFDKLTQNHSKVPSWSLNAILKNFKGWIYTCIIQAKCIKALKETIYYIKWNWLH